MQQLHRVPKQVPMCYHFQESGPQQSGVSIYLTPTLIHGHFFKTHGRDRCIGAVFLEIQITKKWFHCLNNKMPYGWSTYCHMSNGKRLDK